MGNDYFLAGNCTIILDGDDGDTQHNAHPFFSIQHKIHFRGKRVRVSLDASMSDWIDGWMDTAKLLLEAWR